MPGSLRGDDSSAESDVVRVQARHLLMPSGASAIGNSSGTHAARSWSTQSSCSNVVPMQAMKQNSRARRIRGRGGREVDE